MNTSPKKHRLWDAARERVVPQEDFLHFHFDGHGEIAAVETTEGILVELLGEDPEGTLLQHTGLHDSVGTPIYEADIIDDGDGNYWLVSWDEEHGMFWANWSGNGLSDWTYAASLDGAVVGNKFQSPELIE